MRTDAHQKVKPTHLKRTAYLYIRQSTLRQVFENTESTQRQYALAPAGSRFGLATGSDHRHRFRSGTIGSLRLPIARAFSVW